MLETSLCRFSSSTCEKIAVDSFRRFLVIESLHHQKTLQTRPLSQSNPATQRQLIDLTSHLCVSVTIVGCSRPREKVVCHRFEDSTDCYFTQRQGVPPALRTTRHVNRISSARSTR